MKQACFLWEVFFNWISFVQVGLTLHSWPGLKSMCVCQILVNGGNLILKAEKKIGFQVPVVNPLCKMESSFVK